MVLSTLFVILIPILIITNYYKNLNIEISFLKVLGIISLLNFCSIYLIALYKNELYINISSKKSLKTFHTPKQFLVLCWIILSIFFQLLFIIALAFNKFYNLKLGLDIYLLKFATIIAFLNMIGCFLFITFNYNSLKSIKPHTIQYINEEEKRNKIKSIKRLIALNKKQKKLENEMNKILHKYNNQQSKYNRKINSLIKIKKEIKNLPQLNPFHKIIYLFKIWSINSKQPEWTIKLKKLKIKFYNKKNDLLQIYDEKNKIKKNTNEIILFNKNFSLSTIFSIYIKSNKILLTLIIGLFVSISIYFVCFIFNIIGINLVLYIFEIFTIIFIVYTIYFLIHCISIYLAKINYI
ncbi:MAG: hypothetical protein ACTSRZ_19180 [Promethearchaeota archaeon]